MKELRREKSKVIKERTGNLISRVVSIMQTRLERRFKKFNMTKSQWRIITSLSQNGMKTAADIAKLCNIDSTAVTRLINRLEEKDLLVRCQSCSDRRVNVIKATQKGLALVPFLKKEADENYDEIFGVLTSDEKKQLNNILKKVIDNIK